MKVAVLAPIATSLYSRVVTYGLSRESGVQVELVVVRSPWSLRRMRLELKFIFSSTFLNRVIFIHAS